MRCFAPLGTCEQSLSESACFISVGATCSFNDPISAQIAFSDLSNSANFTAHASDAETEKLSRSNSIPTPFRAAFFVANRFYNAFGSSTKDIFFLLFYHPNFTSPSLSGKTVFRKPKSFSVTNSHFFCNTSLAVPTSVVHLDYMLKSNLDHLTPGRQRQRPKEHHPNTRHR